MQLFAHALKNWVPESSVIPVPLYYDLKATYPVSIKERDSWQLLDWKVAPKWPSVFYVVLYNKFVRGAPEAFATSTYRVTEFDLGWMFQHSTTWRKSARESYEQKLQCRHTHTHTHTGCTSRVQFARFQASYLWMQHCNYSQLLGLKWYSLEVRNTKITWLAHC